jgi:hypothetical protein
MSEQYIAISWAVICLLPFAAWGYMSCCHFRNGEFVDGLLAVAVCMPCIFLASLPFIPF